MLDTKAELRVAVKDNLKDIVLRLNKYLSGKELEDLKPTLKRIGRGGKEPHWLKELEESSTLPNFDGKTVGSVVEMLLTADLEVNLFRGMGIKLKINPASGVDLPDLDLGVKSPSENWCTSEPFTHAYERILGSAYDVVALVTDYQSAKKAGKKSLQIIKYGYFTKSEVADSGLCQKAKQLRNAQNYILEPSMRKGLRFLSYVNQSDWLCKKILSCWDVLGDDDAIRSRLISARDSFLKESKKSKAGINPIYLDRIEAALNQHPSLQALITLADEWVDDAWGNIAQMPDSKEWDNFIRSELNGRLGVSFALQWRYNFGGYFKATQSIKYAEKDNDLGLAV